LLGMDIPMPMVVKVWRGGCIIRSSLLDVFSKAYETDPNLSNLLLDKGIADILKSQEQNLRQVIIKSVENGFASSALMASLGYYDAYRTARLPTNLIQAQRDYFGAHT